MVGYVAGERAALGSNGVAIDTYAWVLLWCVAPTIFLNCIPVADFLQIGITVDSFERFLSTPDGAEFLDRFATTIPLVKGAAVFVPASFVVYHVSYKILERRDRPGLVRFAHLPLSGPLLKDIASDLHGAIVTSNKAKAPSSLMWSTRYEHSKKSDVALVGCAHFGVANNFIYYLT